MESSKRIHVCELNILQRIKNTISKWFFQMNALFIASKSSFTKQFAIKHLLNPWGETNFYTKNIYILAAVHCELYITPNNVITKLMDLLFKVVTRTSIDDNRGGSRNFGWGGRWKWLKVLPRKFWNLRCSLMNSKAFSGQDIILWYPPTWKSCTQHWVLTYFQNALHVA